MKNSRWISLAAGIGFALLIFAPGAFARSVVPMAMAIWNGDSYTSGADILSTDGKIDTSAMNGAGVKTFLQNTVSAATSDWSILGAWTIGDSLTLTQDVLFTGGTGGGITINAPTTINDTLTVADSASFTNDLSVTGAVLQFGTYGTIFKAVMAGQAAFTTSDLIDTVAFNTASTLTATDPAIVSFVAADTTIGITGTIGANGDTLFVARASGGSSAAKYNYIIFDL